MPPKFRSQFLSAAMKLHDSEPYPDGPLDDVEFLLTADRLIEEIESMTRQECIDFVSAYDESIAERMKERFK